MRALSLCLSSSPAVLFHALLMCGHPLLRAGLSEANECHHTIGAYAEVRFHLSHLTETGEMLYNLERRAVRVRGGRERERERERECVCVCVCERERERERERGRDESESACVRRTPE